MLGNLLSVVTIDILSPCFFFVFLVVLFFFLLMNSKLKGRDRAEASRDFAALALRIGSLHINTPCLPRPPSFLLSQLLAPPHFCQLSSQQAQFGSVTKKENPTTWKRGAHTCLCFIVCSFVCFKESYMTHSCFLKNKPNFSE